MMLSQSAEYVLRVVVYLANQDRPCTNQEIAAANQVPAGYLSKLLQSLGRAGIVHSQRGLHGGFVLARSPEELSVLDVINAVDPPRRAGVCPLGITTHKNRLCALHRRLDEAMNLAQQAFAETTIAEILSDCESPAPAQRTRRQKA